MKALGMLLIILLPTNAYSWEPNAYDTAYLECVNITEETSANIADSQWQRNFDYCMGSKGFTQGNDFLLNKSYLASSEGRDKNGFRGGW